jgi:hypothetical protein
MPEHICMATVICATKYCSSVSDPARQGPYTELKNVCVWNKTNGGMGSFYRSKHGLVFVFKVGRALSAIVHDDDIAALECWSKTLFHIKRETSARTGEPAPRTYIKPLRFGEYARFSGLRPKTHHICPGFLPLPNERDQSAAMPCQPEGRVGAAPVFASATSAICS